MPETASESQLFIYCTTFLLKTKALFSTFLDLLFLICALINGIIGYCKQRYTQEDFKRAYG
jgi:hypothetical protein